MFDSPHPEEQHPPLVDPLRVDPPRVDPHWADLSALVSQAEANRVEMCRLQADRVEVCARALELIALRVQQRAAARAAGGKGDGYRGDTIPLREVLAELSAALRVTERTVSSWLGDAAALVGSYPATYAALREGRIDERHASAIIDAGIPLDREHRAEYEAAVLRVAESDTAAGTRVMARIIAARLQPDIVEENQRRALAERRVRMFDLDDGLSRLLLDGPAALIHGIYDRIAHMATAQAAVPDVADGVDADGGDASVADRVRPEEPALGQEREPDEEPDERTLDQRRADIMTDLLLTGRPSLDEEGGLGAIRATAQITIPILTLIGRSDEPALLDGEAPIDAETARALAGAASTWQRVMADPVTAEPLRLDTYRPSKRLRRLLQARDQHCRWPGCRRRARACDADHTVPWKEGGATCSRNLEMLCPHHHTMKHASQWTVVQLGGGTLEFTSPTKRRYRNNAPPVILGVDRRPWARLLGARYDPGDPAPF